MNIHLHIERLILDGMPITNQQGPLVQTAVEAELTRLLTEQGFANSLQAGGALPLLQAQPVQFTPGNSPVQLGTQIAQSVYSGIGNTK
jgi:hypothetical protein